MEFTRSYLFAKTSNGVFFNSSSYNIKNNSYLDVYSLALSDESIT